MLDECICDGVNERLVPDASINRLARDAPSAVSSGTWADASRMWRNLPAPVRCMFKHHTGIWTIDTAVWRNVCLHSKRAVFCVYAINYAVNYVLMMNVNDIWIEFNVM